MRILLVEDDSRIARFVARGLAEEDYAVDLASDGEQGSFMALTNDYDLVILDIMLPKKSGLDVLIELREAGVTASVLLLTAQDSVEDKVKGLDLGADDYLPKPFDFKELLARVRALLRRTGEVLPAKLKIADLELDVLKHKAFRKDRDILLTQKEYAILEYLLRNQGQVVTRTQLAEHVWEHDFDTFSNTINVTVSRLRQKIDGGADLKLIHTLRGRGYMITDQQPDSIRAETAGKA